MKRRLGLLTEAAAGGKIPLAGGGEHAAIACAELPPETGLPVPCRTGTGDAM